MRTLHWKLPQSRFGLRAAIVSDLHNRNHHDVLNIVLSEKPDLILMPGDIFSALNRDVRHYAETNKYSNLAGFELFRRFAEIAPSYFSLGNHESYLTEENRKRIVETGVTLLEDSFVPAGEILIGGLNSVMTPGDKLHTPPPNTGFLEEFSRAEGYKILLSHHPEIYHRDIAPFGFDIVISGHAHGGQWRLGSQGIFAPGQGPFPKYTCGIYDEHLVVSPGLANHTWVPRIFNPPTVIILSF